MPNVSAAALPRIAEARTSTHPSRLLSLDLLRGLTIAFMILVNDNGSEQVAYWPLKHAAWNGFTPTDLVFPTFLLVVGISTVLSFASRIGRGMSRRMLFGHVCRRSILLFLFGLLVNSFPLFHLSTLRVYGVLPRIAVCYFCVASLYLLDQGWRSKVALVAALLIGYWALMRFVPVPGYGVPGSGVPLLDPDRNLAAWTDRHIFSAPHLYEHTRDPEGLLSTLPALGTTLIGLLAGIWLRTERALGQKTLGLLAAGISGVLLGGLWNLTFPINKKLWTSSYVLFAAGLSLLLLTFFLWATDLRSDKEAPEERSQRSAAYTPLLVFGTNAIFAYVFAELLASLFFTIKVGATPLQQWLYQAIHSALPNAAFASLIYSLAFVGVCWLVVYALYRNRIFLKL